MSDEQRHDEQRHCDACGKVVPLDAEPAFRRLTFDTGATVIAGAVVETTPFETIDHPDVCGDCVLRVLAEGEGVTENPFAS